MASTNLARNIGDRRRFNSATPMPRSISEANGVGSNNPHSFPPVIRTDVPSSQYPDASHIPQAAKSFDHSTEALGTKFLRIFRYDKARPNLFNDSQHFEKQARTFSGDSLATTGTANILAREPSGNDINLTIPRATVKRSDIIPNRESWEATIGLSS
jgi:hypothetical protein